MKRCSGSIAQCKVQNCAVRFFVRCVKKRRESFVDSRAFLAHMTEKMQARPRFRRSPCIVRCCPLFPLRAGAFRASPGRRRPGGCFRGMQNINFILLYGHMNFNSFVPNPTGFSPSRGGRPAPAAGRPRASLSARKTGGPRRSRRTKKYRLTNSSLVNIIQ